MKQQEYRPDIDGLRAISALVILAFHLGFTSFSGGFVGVDVFFVISGYLIIPRVADALQAGNFSLAIFFEKRIRRIIPALLAVMLFTFIAGFFVLGPREYKEFSGSAFATLVFGANFYFYDRSGYFADAAHQKPFLHAWSLGIEEQFYILVPLLLLACWSFLRFSPRRVVLLITVSSFAYNLVMVRYNEVNAFFMPMARFWELGIGGLIALYGRDQELSDIKGNLLSAVGVGLLLLSVFGIDDRTRFPGETALLPVAGSAFLIWSGQCKGTLIGKSLGAMPLRYIGRISYSLYLIHWPVIVFVRLYLSRPLEMTEQILIFAFSFLWAALSWHFLERKLLSSQLISFRKLAMGLTVALSILITSGMVVTVTEGLQRRMTAGSLAVLKEVEQELSQGAGSCIERHPFGDSLPKKYGVCGRGNAKGRKVLFWGDSHSGMLVKAMSRLYEDDKFLIYSTGMPDCPPFQDVKTTRRKNRLLCPTFVNQVINFLNQEAIDTVILAGRWANLASDVRSPGDGGRPHKIFDMRADGVLFPFENALLRTVKELKKHGTRVLVVGSVPEIEYHVPDTLVRYLSGIGHLPETSRKDYEVRQKQVLSALEKVEQLEGVTVVHPQNILCDSEKCDVVRNGKVLYTDDDHLSIEGAKPIVREIREHLLKE